MAKVRFYCDVPEYKHGDYPLFATTKPSGQPVAGWKRVAFDVDMPPEVWRPSDVVAPADRARVIAGEEYDDAA